MQEHPGSEIPSAGQFPRRTRWVYRGDSGRGQGGIGRIVEKDGRAKAIEIVFERQPLTYAPLVEELTEGPVKLSITGRDHRLVFVKQQLDEAMAYLHCFFDVDLASDEIEAAYEAESSDEQKQIPVRAMSMHKNSAPLPLAFDMLTRALMAAENTEGPKFEATLVSTARKALSEQQFINSFRYSFLLFESLYGEGQFKSASLKAALKGNTGFKALVVAALKDGIQPKPGHVSDTATLLSRAPSADELIDHIVDKRGLYFHGNVKRKDAWKPDEQETAQALALISIGIAQLVAQQAAIPMFEDSFSTRHFEDAKKAGALIVFQIKFTFREPEENFQHDHQLNITMPGTKVTSRMALSAAQQFFQYFEHSFPVAALDSANCTAQGTGEKIFEVQFHTKD